MIRATRAQLRRMLCGPPLLSRVNDADGDRRGAERPAVGMVAPIADGSLVLTDDGRLGRICGSGNTRGYVVMLTDEDASSCGHGVVVPTRQIRYVFRDPV